MPVRGSNFSTARTIYAQEALDIGFVSAIVDREALDEFVGDLCTKLADHSATTLWVTKEALRRGRVVPEGDDLIREAYGSEGFRANVRAFLDR